MRGLDPKVEIRHFNRRTVGIFSLWLICMGLVASIMDKNFLRIGICLGIFVGFSAWGHVLVFPLHYKKREFLNGFIWGGISGIAIASLITSVIVYVIGWNLLAIFGAVTVLPLFCFGFLWRRTDWNTSPVPDQGPDLGILFAALLIVTFFFYFPFKNLGALVDGKYLYAWLFGHDFINRMVHVDSLSRGLPLESFFFAGETLSYYWLAYVYPALLHNIKGTALEIQQLLELTQLFYSLLAAAGLVVFLNGFIKEKRILIFLILLALVCYSYVGLSTMVVKGWGWLSGKEYLEVYGYKSTGFSGFSHSFYRFFLVEPQATLAIPVMLMIFSMYGTNRTLYGFGIMGLLLGFLFGVEATNGIMTMLWFICAGLYSFATNWQDRFSIGARHFCSILCALLVYVALFSIEMYSFKTGKGALQLAPNWFALRMGALYFPLAYGPGLFLGIAGLIKLYRQRERHDHWAHHYVILLAISLFFVFFIKNPTEPHFGLLKAARIIPICLLILTAYFLRSHLRTAKIGKSILVLLILAFPSIITDNMVASDISNPSTYVRLSDMEAAKWMKKNLLKEAIIQAEPNYPGAENGQFPKYAYSFIPVFAERRTAIGEWKVSSQEHSKPDEVSERFHSIKKMYSNNSVNECIEILKRYGIFYVYVGELERRLYRDGITKFEDNMNFNLIYSKGNVSVFRFVQP